MKKVVLMALCVGMVASLAQAAFIVETHTSGKAFANFASTSGVPSYSIKCTAPGLQATNTAYGGNGTIDEWTYSYTPGVNADNTVFAVGDTLGTHRLDSSMVLTAENQLATGMVGGGSGTYKVFITWPTTGNANAAGSKITITSDGAPIELNPVSQNGDESFPATWTEVGNAGENKWLCIGTVQLTAGNTYKVVQLANATTFVSQRSGGVMWEMVPEPAAAVLLGLGSVLFARRRRA